MNEIPPKQPGWAADALHRMTKESPPLTVETEESRKTLLAAAKRLGISVTSRKIDGIGYRVWRTK